jgi:ubiquinone/menaquinone biosynthesis C-methylase UbiE
LISSFEESTTIITQQILGMGRCSKSQIVWIVVTTVTALIVIYLFVRWFVYVKTVCYKRASQYNQPYNADFDRIYHQVMRDPTRPRYVEADYENKCIDLVDDSYNICYLRKYLHSHPVDSTIELAQIHDGQHILDAGCGSGKTAIYICQQFPHVTFTVILHSQAWLKKVRANIRHAGLDHRITAHLMNFDALHEPVTEQSYDRILFLESMDYSMNRRALLARVHPLLSAHGKLFIKTPMFKNDVPRAKYALCEKLIEIWRYNFSTLSSLLADVHATRYCDVSYVALSPYLSGASINPMDFLRMLAFWKQNKLDVRHASSGVVSNIFDFCFVLATKSPDARTSRRIQTHA